MKRIPKHIREEAALICAIAASGGVRGVHYYASIRIALEGSKKASELAVQAWSEAKQPGCSWTRETDAEAEALIRTGWTPD